MTTPNDNITALIRKAREMAKFLADNPDALTDLHVISLAEKTQYTRQHNARKRKGGSAPIDYTATELKVDLLRALSANDLGEIAKAYYKLNRLVPLH